MLVRLLSEDAAFLALLRAGLEDLTDDEYLWEPVNGCWSVRAVDELTTPRPPWASTSTHAIEIDYPDPIPSPFTTIAWRLVHLTGSIDVATATLIGRRRADGAIDDAWGPGRETAADAATAVALLTTAIGRLQEHVSRATDDDLARLERQWWDAPGSTTPVWEHVVYFGYFEPASHAAEVRLLRDLYRHTDGGRIHLRRAGPERDVRQA